MSQKCWMKKLAPGEQLEMHNYDAVVSGFPCNGKAPPVPAAAQEVPATVRPVPPAALQPVPPATLRPVLPAGTMNGTGSVTFDASDSHPLPALPTHYPNGSVYCFVLMQPTGYELGLMAKHYQMNAGIFACDEYTIFSNVRMEIAPKSNVFTSVVESSLHCSAGGEFKTALNAAIFLAVWTKVMRVGRFRYHDFIVKVDPDAVFLPSRLRPILHKVIEEPNGVYFNNCQFGLHGPIEVFSKNAILNWGNGAAKCIVHFHELCNGPCWWGEDILMDQCLERFLKAKRLNNYNLLVEDHCDPPPNWRSCTDTRFVSFHPFKDVEEWADCHETAVKSDRLHSVHSADKDKRLVST